RSPTSRCCSWRWSRTQGFSRLRAAHGPPPRPPQHPNRADRRGGRAVHVRHDVRRRGALRVGSPLDPEIPPVGEEVHLPGPSLMPFLLACAITAGIVGIKLGFVFWVPGIIVALVVIVRWVRSTQREIEDLPLEHH